MALPARAGLVILSFGLGYPDGSYGGGPGFGFVLSYVLELARNRLDADRSAYLQATTTEKRRQLLEDMNGYFASFRERLKASGSNVDLAIEIRLSEDGSRIEWGAATAAVMGDSSSNVMASSVETASATTASGATAEITSSSESSATVENNPSTEESFVAVFARVAAEIGKAFGGFFIATVKLFA